MSFLEFIASYQFAVREGLRRLGYGCASSKVYALSLRFYWAVVLSSSYERPRTFEYMKKPRRGFRCCVILLWDAETKVTKLLRWHS